MLYIIITIVATVAAAAFCAVPETAIRDASESEIESLKTKSPALGKFAENFRQNPLPPREVLYCARILCAAFAACLSGIFSSIYFPTRGLSQPSHFRRVAPPRSSRLPARCRKDCFRSAARSSRRYLCGRLYCSKSWQNPSRKSPTAISGKTQPTTKTS